jgi:hypothetical protein
MAHRVLQPSRMGTRANTTLGWATTGLLVITAPFVAFAGLDGAEGDGPPAHVAGVSEFDGGDFDVLEPQPDTLTGPVGDALVGVDIALPGSDSGGTPAGDGGGTFPRLPDGGTPTPLVEDTNAGCQCAQARGDEADVRAALPLVGALVVVLRRRVRDKKETGRTPGGASPPREKERKSAGHPSA